MKAWKCTVCNYIHKGDTPPDKCPVCGAGPDKFVEIEIPDSQEKTAAAPSKASGAAPDKSPPDTSKQSGRITTTEEKKTAPTGPQTLYQRITDLMIRHHAHPILVHTPNGILPAAAVLFILAWLFDATLPAKAAVINLIFVVLALPLVLYTGFLEWQKKYNQAYTLLFKLKILAAALTSAACVISMIWYLADPAVLSTPLAWVFIFINIVMLASAGVAGFIGGKLVFKD